MDNKNRKELMKGRSEESLKNLTLDQLDSICWKLNINERTTNNTTTTPVKDVVDRDTIIQRILEYYRLEDQYNNQKNSSNNDHLHQHQTSTSSSSSSSSASRTTPYTRDELNRMYKFHLIDICNQYNIKDVKEDKYISNEEMIQLIIVHQNIYHMPDDSLYCKDYTFPWDIITCIMEMAWNNARYCTCIYPHEIKKIQSRANVLYHGDNGCDYCLVDQVSLVTRHLLEQVRESNKHCPQHAMFYRQDTNPNFQKLPAIQFKFNESVENNKQDQLTWRLSLMSISKKMFHHLSNHCFSNLTLYYECTEENVEGKDDDSFWKHLSQEYNPIKTAKKFYHKQNEYYPYDVAPWWLTNRLEEVVLECDYSEAPSFLGRILGHNTKSLKCDYFPYNFQNLCKWSPNVTKIEIDESLFNLTSCIDYPLKKLILRIPDEIFDTKKTVRDKLEVIKLDINFYKRLPDMCKGSQQQIETQQQQELPVKILQNLFPKLRHIHLKIPSPPYPLMVRFPPTVNTLTIDRHIPELFNNLAMRYITTLRVDHNYFINHIDLYDLKSTPVQRLVCMLYYHITDEDCDKMMEFGFKYLCSKFMANQIRKYIFIRDINNNHNNSRNNNICEVNNNINNEPHSKMVTLPKYIIFEIIRLSWNGIGRCNCLKRTHGSTMTIDQILITKHKCSTHGWYNITDLPFYPFPSDKNKKQLYRIRFRSLSMISKSIRRLVFQQLFTSISNYDNELDSCPPSLLPEGRLNIQRLHGRELLVMDSIEHYQWIGGPLPINIQPFSLINNLQSLDLSKFRIKVDTFMSILTCLKTPLRKLYSPPNMKTQGGISYLKDLSPIQKESLVNLEIGSIDDCNMISSIIDQQFPNVTQLVFKTWHIDKRSIQIPQRIKKITSLVAPSLLVGLVKSNPSIQIFKDFNLGRNIMGVSVKTIFSLPQIRYYIFYLQVSATTSRITQRIFDNYSKTINIDIQYKENYNKICLDKLKLNK